MANLSGINADTGKALSGAEHLKQSIRDILGTRVGTRVMRRDYGSRLPNLVDNPLNELTRTNLFAEVAGALDRWEPRFKLDRTYIDSVTEQGSVVVTLEGRNLLDGQAIRIEGIVL